MMNNDATIPKEQKSLSVICRCVYAIAKFREAAG
jgi:hypothetical protein